MQLYYIFVQLYFMVVLNYGIRMLSEEEFNGVYEEHFDAIRKYVYYRYGDVELASDVAQDVFMRVWENRLFLDVHHLVSLLYKMAIDYGNMNYRKQRYQMNLEQSMAFEESVELSPEDELLFNELTAIYAKTLEQMPERQRIVYLMSREDGRAT